MPRKVQLTETFLRLKRLREEHRLTQRELAEMSGIAEGTIKAWDSGRVQSLDLDAIRQLAPVYGMTPEALVRHLIGTEPAQERNPAITEHPRTPEERDASQAMYRETIKQIFDDLQTIRDDIRRLNSTE